MKALFIFVILPFKPYIVSHFDIQYLFLLCLMCPFILAIKQRILFKLILSHWNCFEVQQKFDLPIIQCEHFKDRTNRVKILAEYNNSNGILISITAIVINRLYYYRYWPSVLRNRPLLYWKIHFTWSKLATNFLRWCYFGETNPKHLNIILVQLNEYKYINTVANVVYAIDLKRQFNQIDNVQCFGYNYQLSKGSKCRVGNSCELSG